MILAVEDSAETLMLQGVFSFGLMYENVTSSVQSDRFSFEDECVGYAF